ncbi:hypothetical protein J2129_000855 [Methanofollis sp. W23]|nr:hypothetical protein [Methanofollis sp. W23]
MLDLENDSPEVKKGEKDSPNSLRRIAIQGIQGMRPEGTFYNVPCAIDMRR